MSREICFMAGFPCLESHRRLSAEAIADAAELSLRALLVLATAEQPHNLTALLPQLEQLVWLIRGKAAHDGAQDRLAHESPRSHGWEDIGERDERQVGRGGLCARCVKVLQRERLCAYEQANEQCAMRYVRWKESKAQESRTQTLNPKP